MKRPSLFEVETSAQHDEKILSAVALELQKNADRTQTARTNNRRGFLWSGVALAGSALAGLALVTLRQPAGQDQTLEVAAIDEEPSLAITTEFGEYIEAEELGLADEDLSELLEDLEMIESEEFSV